MYDALIGSVITATIFLIICLLLKLRATIKERDFYKTHYDYYQKQLEMQENMFSDFMQNPLQERPVFSPPKIINKSSTENRKFTQ